MYKTKLVQNHVIIIQYSQNRCFFNSYFFLGMMWPKPDQEQRRCQVLRYVGRYLWATLQFFSLSTSLPVAVSKEKKSPTSHGNRKFSNRWARNSKKHGALHLYPITCKEPKKFLSWQKFRKEEKVKDNVLSGPELCLSIQRALMAGGCLPMNAHTLNFSSLRPSKTLIWSGQMLLFLPLLEAEILQSLPYSNLAQKLYFWSRQR